MREFPPQLREVEDRFRSLGALAHRGISGKTYQQGDPVEEGKERAYTPDDSMYKKLEKNEKTVHINHGGVWYRDGVPVKIAKR